MIRRHSTIAALAFAAALLSSCGSDPQTGTSSETQTELQLLADNSRWITKPQSGTSSGQLRRRGVRQPHRKWRRRIVHRTLPPTTTASEGLNVFGEARVRHLQILCLRSDTREA